MLDLDVSKAPAEAALEHLRDDLGPRLLAFLFEPPNAEKARTLHTELRQVLEIAKGAATW